MLFKAQAITKSFGPLKVLTDANIQINEGDSIGLIGVNGAGKSTFLKILLGQEKPDTGELTVNTNRVGYLEQFAESSENITVRDVLGRPYGHIENIKRRMKEIEELMASGQDIDWNAIASEYSQLEKDLEQNDMKDEKNLVSALKKVGLSPDLMDRSMPPFRRGKDKVMLSRIIVRRTNATSW